jgi:hypothetical protein
MFDPPLGLGDLRGDPVVLRPTPSGVGRPPRVVEPALQPLLIPQHQAGQAFLQLGR